MPKRKWDMMRGFHLIKPYLSTATLQSIQEDARIKVMIGCESGDWAPDWLNLLATSELEQRAKNQR